MLLDRSLQVLSLLLHFSAQLCYGCIVSVHSLLLLPQVVLHGRHLVLHLPAILNLLQDAPLLLPTTPNLCVEFCYLLGMVEVYRGFFFDFELVCLYLHLDIVYFAILLMDQL